MQITLTTEQFAILRQLINTAVDNVPDENLTEDMLTAVTRFNAYMMTMGAKD